MSNLYWSIYKNLENELLSLTNQIHFDDKQLNVYSTKLVDLILRASIEIESISKDIYARNGGNSNPVDEHGNPKTLYFDTDCLEYLNKKWNICDKEISIIATNTYFTNKTNITFQPLKNSNKRGKNTWKIAYQAIKHNREENLLKASLKNCIYAIGALYILNLYFIDKEFSQNDKLNNFDSQFFAPSCQYVSFELPTGKVLGDYSKSIFLEAHSNEIFNQAVLEFEKEHNASIEYLVKSNEFQTFMSQNPNYDMKDKNLLAIANDVGGTEFMRKVYNCTNKKSSQLLCGKLKIFLNKNQKIYEVNH